MNKKAFLIAAASVFAFSGSAFAQDNDAGVTMSTDPARAEQIEQHANEISSHAQMQGTQGMQEESKDKSQMHGKHHHHHHGKKGAGMEHSSGAMPQ